MKIRFFKTVAPAVALVLFSVTVASAEPAFYSAPTVDATAVGTMCTSILAALALLWGARKAIKTINRS